MKLNEITASGNISSSGHISASGAHLNGEFKVGVDGTGHDVKFFGDTSARFIHFDADNDIMKFADNTILGIGSGPSATLGDTTIKSDGSETDILTSVGTTMIRSTANDGSITIKTLTNPLELMFPLAVMCPSTSNSAVPLPTKLNPLAVI